MTRKRLPVGFQDRRDMLELTMDDVEYVAGLSAVSEDHLAGIIDSFCPPFDDLYVYASRTPTSGQCVVRFSESNAEAAFSVELENGVRRTFTLVANSNKEMAVKLLSILRGKNVQRMEASRESLLKFGFDLPSPPPENSGKVRLEGDYERIASLKLRMQQLFNDAKAIGARQGWKITATVTKNGQVDLRLDGREMNTIRPNLASNSAPKRTRTRGD